MFCFDFTSAKLTSLRNNYLAAFVIVNAVWLLLVETLVTRSQLNVLGTNPLGKLKLLFICLISSKVLFHDLYILVETHIVSKQLNISSQLIINSLLTDFVKSELRLCMYALCANFCLVCRDVLCVTNSCSVCKEMFCIWGTPVLCVKRCSVFEELYVLCVKRYCI